MVFRAAVEAAPMWKDWEEKYFVGMPELVRTIFSFFWNQCFLEHENGLC